MEPHEKALVKTEGQDDWSTMNFPIPPRWIGLNLGIFVPHDAFVRTLFFYELYRRILNVPGVLMEFGVRWGRDLITLQHLRAVLEPRNATRKIIGFDTWSGFSSVSNKDSAEAEQGYLDVTDGYLEYLADILAMDQRTVSLPGGPAMHELVQGDARETLPKYLEEHPETIVAFAYMDMDLYKPTKDCLRHLLSRMPKGGIIAFDEACWPRWPGETIALLESVDLKATRLRRFPWFPIGTYMVVE